MEQPPEKPTIVDWFDPYNPEHCRAYRELENTGSWPESFIPGTVFIPLHWQQFLRMKMVDAWLDAQLGEQR